MLPRRKPTKAESTAERGRWGEDRAARFLSQSGYRILEKNFRRATGEVDIVCERAGYLVFVEVKRWPRAFMSELSSALSGVRQERLRRTAELFLVEKPEFRSYGVRFDIVFVATDGEEVDHFPGAL